MKPLVFIYLFLFLATNAFADSWSSPTPRTVASPKGEFLLRTIPPRRLGEGNDEFTKMKFIVYRLDPATQDYQETTRFDVEENPIEFFINDTGDRIVTMDQYFMVGKGPRVVVVYDSTGKELKTWALKDFYDKEGIKHLSESISSIHWRGEAGWISDQSEILIRKATHSFEADIKFEDYVLNVRTLKITKWKFPLLKGIAQER